MAAVPVLSDFWAQENKIKSVTASTFSLSICHEVMGPDAMILVSWMLSFKPTFSLSSRGSLVPLYFLPLGCCHLHILEKEMVTHSSVLAWRIPWTEKPGRLQSMGSHRVGHDWSDLVVVVVSAYLRLLIFLPAILTPACASFSPAFLMMYSAYELNKQGDNIQPWCTPFPIWNQSVVSCPVLTVTSWPVYRFLRRQVRWSAVPISLRIFHSVLWSTQRKAFV